MQARREGRGWSGQLPGGRSLERLAKGVCHQKVLLPSTSTSSPHTILGPGPSLEGPDHMFLRCSAELTDLEKRFNLCPVSQTVKL